MSPFRRKAVDNAIVAVLRDCPGAARTAKSLRPLIAERLDGCSPAEFAGAVQALRYQGKLEWDRIELRDSMKSRSNPEEPAVHAAVPTGRCMAVEQEEGPSSREASVGLSAPSSGPDDEDGPGDEYPGEVNDAEQAVEGRAGVGPVPGESEARNVPDALRPDQPAVQGGGVEEPRPDAAVDQPPGAEHGRQGAPAGSAAGASLGGGFVPRSTSVKAGVHAAQTRAAARPLPAPEHEPEIARLVREEVNEHQERVHRARSTGTVRQPLELKKFGMPDLSFAEGVASLLAENPNDLMLAISRKHPLAWRRVIQLGRATGKRPAEALYWALERGLMELEAMTPPAISADAA